MIWHWIERVSVYDAGVLISISYKIHDVNGIMVHRSYDMFRDNPNNPYYLYRLESKYRYSGTLYDKLKHLLSYVHRNISYYRLGEKGVWGYIAIAIYRVYTKSPIYVAEYTEFYNNSRFKISHFINN